MRWFVGKEDDESRESAKGERELVDRWRADCLVRSTKQQQSASGGDDAQAWALFQVLFPDSARPPAAARQSNALATWTFIQLATMRILDNVSCRQKNVGLAPPESPPCYCPT
jgi:hypothetical protein